MKDGQRVLYCFGDSIMAQDKRVYAYESAERHFGQLGRICAGYPTLLEREFGLVAAKNGAAGGHGAAEQEEVIRAVDFRAAELVLISVGVNDFSLGRPIGALPAGGAPRHDDTFIGRYCAALDHIFASNPLVRAVLMTPLYKDTTDRTKPGWRDSADRPVAGQMLADFAAAVREIGRFYGCPVADMYAESGLNRLNLKQLTFDGVHPTDRGYACTFPVLRETVRRALQQAPRKAEAPALRDGAEQK